MMRESKEPLLTSRRSVRSLGGLSRLFVCPSLSKALQVRCTTLQYGEKGSLSIDSGPQLLGFTGVKIFSSLLLLLPYLFSDISEFDGQEKHKVRL